ncbi:MAG TPA: dihydrodipicolinate reductase C-terminal domain-containing protein [Candidatus Dormibacteraeota bacterium]|nr:dihydrodipicolinate reductase C-terminal domain-containing protein [Candidatus Dormibacteraeota bacterium]
MSRGLAIVGHGKMGRLIEDLAPEYGFEVRLTLNSRSNAGGAGLIVENVRNVDVAMEFSNSSTAPDNIRQLATLGIPVVAGTTGWFHELASVQNAILSNTSSLVWSPNFSVGLHRFREIVAEAGRVFAAESDYQSWGWEIHHGAKRDAPSGTLLALAQQMKKSGFDRPINLSSNRAGVHPGTHEIGFDSNADTITIRHTARSREGFARGALRAAGWIIGKKGSFEFREIVHELG